MPRWLSGAVTCLLVVLAASPARAGQARVGRGVGATVAPPIYYVNGTPEDAGASRVLYRKADLGELPSGVAIDAIEFDKRLSGSLASGTFAIYIKNSTATSLPAMSTVMASLAGMTQVFATTSAAIPAPSGYVKFDFATPLTYTGDALEVVTVWDSMSGVRTDDLLFGYHSTGPVETEQFGAAPDALAGSANLPASSGFRVNTTFDFAAPGHLSVETRHEPIPNGATVSNDLAFAIGAIAHQRYTLRNTGDTTITLVAPVFSAPANLAAAPTVLSTIPATLAAGATTDVELEMTPQAGNVKTSYDVVWGSDAGDHAMTFTGVAGTTPKPTLELDATDATGRASRIGNNSILYLGNLVVGEAYLVDLDLANIGSGPLHAEYPGCNVLPVTNAMVAVTTTLGPMTIAQGTEGHCTVSITPLTTGSTTANIRITSDDPLAGVYEVTLAATSINLPSPTTPQIQVFHDTTEVANGGSVTVPFDTTALDFVVKNTGDGVLHIGTVDILPPLINNTFLVTNMNVGMLTPGGEKTVKFIGSVSDATQPASFGVTMPSDDGFGNSAFTFTVHIQPLPAFPIIALSSPAAHLAVDLDSDSGNVAMTSLVIANTGGADLVVTTIVFEGDGRVTPTITLEPSYTIPAGQALQLFFSLAFVDTKQQYEWTKTVRVTSTDLANPTISFDFTGTVSHGPFQADTSSGGCCDAGGAPNGEILVGIALLLVRKPRRHRRL